MVNKEISILDYIESEPISVVFIALTLPMLRLLSSKIQ